MGLNRRIIPPVVASTADPINDPFGDGSQTAYYPFNNSVTDVQNNYTPPWSGTPCFNLTGVDGTSNGAISADGSHSSSGSGETFLTPGVLPSTNTNIVANPWSISFHYKVRNCSDSGSNTLSQDILNIEAGIGLYITVNNGYLQVRINDGGSWKNDGSGTQFGYGWAHVVVQITSTKQLKVWINSINAATSVAMSSSVYTQTGTKEWLFVNLIEQPISNVSQGTVDNLRFFNKTLSSSEISYLDTNLL